MSHSHGCSGHPNYARWYRMMRRCYEPREAQYRNYGGRGITVCSEWHRVETYLAYVDSVLGPCPGPDYSIDRIDNDGNYEPGNLRWTTRSVQNANQRQRILIGFPAGATGYRGVYRKPGHRYEARMYRGGKGVTLGWFDTAEEAARAYDEAVLARSEYRLRLNLARAS